MSRDDVFALTHIDPWFLDQLEQIVELEEELRAIGSLDACSDEKLRQAKRFGFSDRQLCTIWHTTEAEVRERRKARGIVATFKAVDTCAAEFEAYTPYYYSTYEQEDEIPLKTRKRIMILGGGPNRIGQGIEFDYCCVHAVQALSERGYETILLNSNPETVSTDYDTANRLYFEPLTLEDILNVVEAERPRGVLVQFGGQTPLNIAKALHMAGAPIWGTTVDTIDLAEDRQRFNALLRELEIEQPRGATALNREQAVEVANAIGYPVIVRPSYVLGGRGMGIVFNDASLLDWLDKHIQWGEHPVLIDQFLDDTFEFDVDALGDGEHVTIGGIMEHIEEAGVHSGDSACVIPPYKVSMYHLEIIREYTQRIGLALGIKGLFNIQFALKDEIVYVLEVNPRASRTVPYVSKATGHPLARYAAQIAAGKTLSDLDFLTEPPVDGFFVKEAVLPFQKFPGVDARLGPEMRSTGEVMGHASTFGHAFSKAQMAVNSPLPLGGALLISVNPYDQAAVVKIARDFHKLGFNLLATAGTARWLEMAGLPVRVIHKVSEGSPNVLDVMRAGEVDLILNTPRGGQAHQDGSRIRSAAHQYGIPIMTTLSAAMAAVQGIRAMQRKPLKVRSLQTHHGVGD
jgi:carbamoyl-phosphate synthase large subunit